MVDTTTRRPVPGSAPRSHAVPKRLLARTRHLLPQGRALPSGAWRQRHRTLLALLWLHAFALPAFGIARGYPVLHSISEGLVLVVIAGVALLAGARPRLASALVSFGLVTCSAILVHLSGGYIEAHFHFFVVIVLITLYEDWIPLLLAAAYTGFHHGLLGTIDPASVYNHPDAIAHPWKWAAIHAGFVAGAGIAAVGAWRLNEELRAENREAYRQAHESEERFKSAFEEAPIGMGLVGIEPATEGRFLHVNRSMSELLGYSREEFSHLTFREITHPDDLEESVATFARIVAGDVSTYDLEKRYVRADGNVIWAAIHVSLVHDHAGNALYAIGQLQDVTERKAARELLTLQALHDELTGLSNRRSLLIDLESLLGAPSNAESELLLFDLDGFKAYNDTFGHPAGDALLSRLARRLGQTVQGNGGRAYRMGGDEFCVLAPARSSGSVSLAEAAVAALAEHGDGFTVTASHGSVLLPTEARSPAAALRKADQRMYAQKNTRRDVVAQDQITRALITIADERSGTLRTHQDAVRKLCEGVGSVLGLAGSELTALSQAASLHDIGKIAIPDDILNKPGPLSPEEWEFMQRHTLVGERIVGAAPALGPVAKLIRSSHERYDGSGYPDRLAGDDIPLGARIIAVCDAYEAMTSDRPYDHKRTPEEAVEEIRRSAGSQFDPVVVEAFCAFHAQTDLDDADGARTSAA